MKVFLIGDSISIHYGPYLEEYLRGIADYSRKGGGEAALKDLDSALGANGGDSSNVLAYMGTKAASGGFDADALLVNCGLHDVKTDPVAGAKQVPQEKYSENLEEIVRAAASMDLPMIWIRTTPCDEKVHNAICKSFFRYSHDVVAYNEIADRVMAAHGIPAIDLYSFTLNCGEELYCDYVHFTDAIRRLQAAFIAGWLSSASASVCGRK